MSLSFRLKSHPDKLLVKHLQNVGRFSRDILNSKMIENREIFANVAYLIGITHDFGKSTTYFQEYLNKNKKTQNAQHGFLSSIIGYLCVRNYLSTTQIIEKFWYLPGIAWIVINKHHGDLKDLLNEESEKLRGSMELGIIKLQLEDIFSKGLSEVVEMYRFLDCPYVGEILSELKDSENLENDLKEIMRSIRKDIKKICRESFKRKELKYYFLILFFYSVLLDADKLDASGRDAFPERVDIPDNLVDKYKELKFGKQKSGIDVIREKAYKDVIKKINEIEMVSERIFSVNLPTGSGKTLTGLSYALKLRRKIKEKMGFLPRIIYALPFLSIIDQNASVINEILKMEYKKIPSNIFLVHHHLSDVNYRELKDGELDVEEINRSLLLTEGWYSEIVITTFVQLFHTLITNKNRAARKFHNIANSIIILDEIQSIPYKYWLLINHILRKLSSFFNSWIILMTATKPLIFKEEEIKELVNDSENYFNAFDRVNFNFHLQPEKFEDFKNRVLREILNNKDDDLLVILNTIDSSKKLYEFLKEKLTKFYGDFYIDEDGIAVFKEIELIYLSSHILPFYRLRKINRIRSEQKSKRKIVISTQLVEAGVDISSSVVYRDFAPLDSLIQSAGRCNRNNEKSKGIVKVFVLKDEKNEFYKYIYDSMLIDATKKILMEFNGIVGEKEFVLKAAQKYYKKIAEWGSKDESIHIWESLLKLEFSKLSEFKLIPEDLLTISLFIEIDEEAEKVRETMEEIIKNKKGFQQKLELLKIRKKINNYTLNFRVSKQLWDYVLMLNPIDNMERYRYIKRQELKKFYKTDSGVYFNEPNNGSFII